MQDKQEQISLFLRSKFGDVSTDEVTLTAMDGLSNEVFKFEFKGSSFIYKKFGDMKDIFGKEDELRATSALSSKNMAPTTIIEENDFRIETYLENVTPTESSELFADDIIAFLIEAQLILIMSADLYYMKNDIILPLTRFQDTPTNDVFSLMQTKMLDKAGMKYTQFLSEREGVDLQCDIISQFMQSFGELFSNFSNCLLSFNHNDIHRLNVLQEKSTGKKYLIDFEYACLAPFGSDIANYLMESCFNYDVKEQPFFKLDQSRSFEDLHKLYVLGIRKIMDRLDPIDPYTVEQIESFNYFVSLLNLRNAFWTLYSLVLLEWNDVKEGKNFYLEHAVKRIKLIS